MNRKIGMIVLVVLMTAACESGSEGSSNDPWGLSDVPEPTTQEQVNVIFLGMPDEIDGMTASHDDPDHVSFVDYTGDGTWANIVWIEAGPDGSATIEFLDGIATIAEFTEVSSSLNADDTFVWLEGTAPGPDGDMYALWWGDPTDGWIFSVEADSLAHRDAVVDAFIASAEA